MRCIIPNGTAAFVCSQCAPRTFRWADDEESSRQCRTAALARATLVFPLAGSCTEMMFTFEFRTFRPIDILENSIFSSTNAESVRSSGRANNVDIDDDHHHHHAPDMMENSDDVKQIDPYCHRDDDDDDDAALACVHTFRRILLRMIRCSCVLRDAFRVCLRVRILRAFEVGLVSRPQINAGTPLRR